MPGRCPTPLLPYSSDVWIKLDSLTGTELTGNKVRKLEFLLAEALEGGADCVISIGGTQSNHCRAVALACAMLGIPKCILILRVDGDPNNESAEGNLLLSRLAGAEVRRVTREEYSRLGSAQLLDQACETARREGRKPYAIGVGGSSVLGTWGYIQAAAELDAQLAEYLNHIKFYTLRLSAPPFDYIFLACGSGGTVTGLMCAYRHSPTQVVGCTVSDNCEYFHNYIDAHLLPSLLPGASSRALARLIEAKGPGYAKAGPEVFDTIARVARGSGVVLDPVYTAKAFHAMEREVATHPEQYRGKRILFWHTGGVYANYAHSRDLLAAMERNRLDS